MASMFDAQLHQLPHNCSINCRAPAKRKHVSIYQSIFFVVFSFSLWSVLCDFVAFELLRFILMFHKHLSFCASTLAVVLGFFLYEHSESIKSIDATQFSTVF